MKFLLDEVPWGFKYQDVKPAGEGLYRYSAPILPKELRPYMTKDFSYARWREDEDNAHVLPCAKGNTIFQPRPHQTEAANKILHSFNAGWRGFLEADSTGLGKTLSTLSGIAKIAAQEGYNASSGGKGMLLIVCPKSVIPQWRQTLYNYPQATDRLRVVIINYQQLNKLLAKPSEVSVAKKVRTKNRKIASSGTTKVNWDYIIFDEAHYMKNYPSSTMSVAGSTIAQLNKVYKKGVSPFVIYSTATPGATPLNMSLMAGIIAPLIDKEATRITPKVWGDFLLSKGFAVTKGKTGWAWATIPWYGKNSTDLKEKHKYDLAVARNKGVQRADSQRIGKALIKPHAPFIMRSPKDIAGWPEQLPIPFPIQLTAKQVPIYAEAWTRFRNFLNLSPTKRDPKTALVENLRYRQKSSLLKVDSVSEFIKDQVEAGNQVYVSCMFIETIDRLAESLTKGKIRVGEMSGRNVSERENVRIAFQKGQLDVVLCTVVAGISLHAGETLPDGSKASSKARVSIIHDIRPNNLETDQSMGRAHRDGQNSVTYFPYIERTVEEKVIASYTNKTANMKSMTGSTIDSAQQYELIFREAAAKNTKPNQLS